MQLKNLLAQSLLWRGLYFVSVLLINVFLSRFLQAEWVGWLYYSCNIFSLIVLVISLNLDASLTYFSSAEKVDKDKLLWLAVVWCAIVGAVSFLLLKIFQDYLPQHIGFAKKDITWFAFLYIIGIICTNAATALFYAQRNFKTPNIILVLINFGFLLFLMLQPQTDEGLLHLIHVYFYTFILQGFLLIFFLFSKKNFSSIQLPQPSAIRKIYSYAMIALLGNIVFFLVYRIDYWFVQHYCSPAQTGNYVQVSKLGQMMLILPQILASAVFPQTAVGVDMHVTRESIMTICRLLTTIYFVVIAFVLVAGHWLFPMIFGSSFDQMYIPFLLLLPGIWSLSVLALLAAYFAGKGNVKINVIGGLLSVAVMVVGNFIFLPRGAGINAAAAISTVSYFLYMFYLLRRFNADYKMSVKNFLFISKKDLRWFKDFFIKSKIAL